MNASEQELQAQIARAREALQSVRASQKAGTAVRILGVIAGLLVVAYFVFAFVGMVTSLAKSGELQKAVEQRAQTEVENLQASLPRIAKEVAPVYMREIRRMLQDVDVRGPLLHEVQLGLEEIKPVALREIARVRPSVMAEVQAAAQATLADMEQDLTLLLERRLEEVIQQQAGAVKEQVNVSEDEVATILANVTEANEQALMNVVRRRWQQSEEHLNRIAEMVDQIPALPPMSEEELARQTGLVLIALTKYKLPAYDFPPGTELPPAPPLPPPGPQIPADVLERMPEPVRQQVLQALREASVPREGVPGGLDLSKLPPETQQAVREALGRMEQQ